MPQPLPKGGNASLPTTKITIRAKHKGPDTDLSALLLGASGKVRSERDFIFYGEPASACGSVKYGDKKSGADGYAHELTIELAKVPADVEKIAVTLTIDPETPKTFSEVKELVFAISDSTGELIAFNASGDKENAFIIAEVYKRNGVWKVRHVAQGFVNGLKGIATNFGVAISDDEPAATPAATPASGTTAAAKPAATATPSATATPQQTTPSPAKKVSLSKVDQVTADLTKKGSRLISLQKAASISLKKNKLDGVVARVIMVLDASGSTHRMWPTLMQAATDRLATVALNMDDNGELEFWVYATSAKQFANVTLTNLDSFIKNIQAGGDGNSSSPATAKKSGGFLGGIFGGSSSGGGIGGGIVPGLGYDNNEPIVMQPILDECKGNNKIPTLVLFVTDGGIDKGKAIQKVLIDASHHPIFWQFIGLGGSNYGVLEDFDTMTGRHVDNASFFSIDDFKSVSDAELYDRMLKEFPLWLEKVKSLGMLL